MQKKYEIITLLKSLMILFIIALSDFLFLWNKDIYLPKHLPMHLYSLV